MTTTDFPPPIDFLGVKITPLDVAKTAEAVAGRDPGLPLVYVVTPNAQHVVALDQGDRNYARVHAHAWLVTCDSQILRLLGRTLFGLDLPLAAGSDLTALLLKRYIKPDDAVTVIGGDEKLFTELRAQYGLTRIAHHEPPMGLVSNPAAIETAARFIVEHPARYVFIACGCPQSEMVALRAAELGGAVGVALCIGGSLHFATGLIPRAPAWMRRFALESLHRLWLNPRRHAKRVFKQSLPVVWIAVKARLGFKHHAPTALPPAEGGR